LVCWRVLARIIARIRPGGLLVRISHRSLATE
jgi:hypothetical protein